VAFTRNWPEGDREPPYDALGEALGLTGEIDLVRLYAIPRPARIVFEPPEGLPSD
jgi:hypothetical protein